MRGTLCKGLDFLALQFENKDKEKQYNLESPVRARVPGLTNIYRLFPQHFSNYKEVGEFSNSKIEQQTNQHSETPHSFHHFQATTWVCSKL